MSYKKTIDVVSPSTQSSDVFVVPDEPSEGVIGTTRKVPQHTKKVPQNTLKNKMPSYDDLFTRVETLLARVETHLTVVEQLTQSWVLRRPSGRPAPRFHLTWRDSGHQIDTTTIEEAAQLVGYRPSYLKFLLDHAKDHTVQLQRHEDQDIVTVRRVPGRVAP